MSDIPSARTPKKKVGIMGGTFDPIHIGHLILGESAYQQFGLDHVLFMPSGNPPHKKNREGRATNEQRVEMVRLAIESNPHFVLSLEEMHEMGYIYTSHTLGRLKAANPDTEYYFIMGADSMLDFDTWHEPQLICDRAVLVVAVRDHMPSGKLDSKMEELRQMFHADFRKLSTLNIDISSHMLREWVACKRSCRYYLPDNVIRYIGQNAIYQKSDGLTKE